MIKNNDNIFSNDVDSFDSVSFLYLSPKLHTVTFRGNPISSDLEYQDRMLRYFPRLKSLDPASKRARYKRYIDDLRTHYSDTQGG